MVREWEKVGSHWALEEGITKSTNSISLQVLFETRMLAKVEEFIRDMVFINHPLLRNILLCDESAQPRTLFCQLLYQGFHYQVITFISATPTAFDGHRTLYSTMLITYVFGTIRCRTSAVKIINRLNIPQNFL